MLNFKNIFFITNCLKKHRKAYIFFIILDTIMRVLLYISQIFIIKNMINSLCHNNYKSLTMNLIIFIIIILIVSILGPLSNYNINKICRLMYKDLNSLLYRKLLSIPTKYYEENSDGQVLSLLMNDLKSIEELYMFFSSITFSFVFGIISIFCMFKINLLISFIIITVQLSQLYFNKYISKKLYKLGENNSKQLEILNKFVHNILNGFYIIKVFILNSKIEKKFKVLNNSYSKILLNKSKLIAIIDSSNLVLNNINMLITIIIGVFLLKGNRINLGEIIAILQLQVGIQTLFNLLDGAMITFNQYKFSLQRVSSFLNEPDENLTKGESISINNIDCIAIKSLSFKYDQSNTILSNINYIFKKNSINVIVGASGKGKSTFIKILLGFYRVYSGSIKIGDIELRNISLKDLRNIISYTPQDTDLFTGTIEYNLKIGNESATEDDLIKACKIAHIHEFIKNLPNGYQSWLGECGIKLSGGEKQRICIARALIKNAKILILDEPTSELDMNSEEIILRNLKNNIKNNIIIIITHRKKVLDYSDSILEL